jgi:hypothetical protein
MMLRITAAIRPLPMGEVTEDRDGLLNRPYFSPTLNGGSLPGGTVSSAIASSIATMT